MVAKGIGSWVTQTIIIGLGIFLLFVFLQSPIQAIKDQALFHLLLLGIMGITIYAGSTEAVKDRLISWFDIKDGKDLFRQAGIGIIFGFVGLVLVALILQSFVAIQGLGAVNNNILLASISVDGALFAGVVAPITEVFILVGLTLGLRGIFSKFLNLKKLMYLGLISAIMVALFFGAFHFYAKEQVAASQGIAFPYESSIGGLIQSITDVHDLGSPAYVGAFPQVILGLFWIILALLYKSFIVPIFSHLVSNSTILFLQGPQNPEVVNVFLLIFIILFAIMAVSIKFGLLEQITKVDLKGLTLAEDGK